LREVWRIQFARVWGHRTELVEKFLAFR
jgi:hypothetical protein